MTEFKKVATFVDGEILAHGNDRILRLPRMADIKYQFADIGKKVGVAALSAVIESQRPFRTEPKKEAPIDWFLDPL